tara:strand:- start:891 stop:1085 length:195 start_codon:yes stop_codon:yes gene_type:complete
MKTRDFIIYPEYNLKQNQQKKLDQDIAAFLKAGGQIQYIPVGETRDFGINDNDYKKVLRAKQNN